jgi:hypothetical protein
MSQLSNYLENALINHIYKGTQYTSPSSSYVALFISDPTDAASGTEVTGSGYTRMEMTTASWSATSNGTISNSAQITFPTASGPDWGTITHAALFDSGSGGNMLHYGPLNASVTVNTNDGFVFAAGQLVLSLA